MVPLSIPDLVLYKLFIYITYINLDVNYIKVATNHYHIL